MKRTVLFLISFICFLSVQKAKASHAVGADLTYECINANQNKYRVTLSLYRDCVGINPENNYTIYATSPSCGYAEASSSNGWNNNILSFTLSAINGTGQEVSPICPNASSTCTGGNNNGVQEWVYTGVVTLPSDCPDWVLYFDLTARNALINTITSPGDQDLYVEAHLNNFDVDFNSSPIFTNRPVPFVCVGQEYCFNHGAIDYDGDSLAYTLITPMTDPNETVNYLSGYSANQPLNSNPPITIDPVTGDICMTPQSILVTVMAVQVDEYRDGVLIGSVIRDIQINTFACSNENPQVDGIDGTGVFEADVCWGSPFCFFTNSIDADWGQDITIEWNGGIWQGDASFISTGGNLPTGDFCWTPQEEDVRSLPYCFTVTVTDDNCPYYGSQTYSFCLTVIDADLNLTPDQSIPCGELATLEATSSFANATFSWSTGETGTTIQVSEEGLYTVTMKSGGCSKEESVFVSVTGIPEVDAGFDQVVECGALANLQATPSGGTGNFVYSWSTGEQSAMITQGSGIYIVEVNDGSCLAIDTVVVSDAGIIIEADFSFTDVCLGGTTDFMSTSVVNIGTIAYWDWTFNEDNVASGEEVSFLFESPGEQTVLLEVETVSGCKDQVIIPVQVFAIPESNLFFNDICLEDAVTFENLSVISSGTINNYLWDFGDNSPISSIVSPVYSYNSPGVYNVTLVAISDHGCSSVNAGNLLNVFELPAVSYISVEVCQNELIELWNTSTTADGSLANAEWFINEVPVSTGFHYSSLANTVGSFEVELVMTKPQGCENRDVQTLLVHELPTVLFGSHAVCTGEEMEFNNQSFCSDGQVTSWEWDFGDGQSGSLQEETHIYSQPGIHPVQLIIESEFGCRGMEEQLVNTYPIPEANFSPEDVCQDQAFTLMDNSTISSGEIISWLWEVNQGDVFTLQNPTYTFVGNGNFPIVLTIESDHGCVNYLEKEIKIHDLPVVNFVANIYSGCSPIEVNFSPKIALVGGNVSEWNWIIGGVSMNDEYPILSLNEGLYSVNLQVVSSFGCIGESEQLDMIEAYPHPEAAFELVDSVISIFNSEVTYNNLSQGGVQYGWDFGDGSNSTLFESTHTYQDTGIFVNSLLVINQYGCTDITEHVVEIKPEFILYIPNSFTPNDDGFNDQFFCKGIGIKDFKLIILDRWGNYIFDSNNILEGWDGKVEGGSHQPQIDTYVYRVDVVDDLNEEHRYVGHVNIIR